MGERAQSEATSRTRQEASSLLCTPALSRSMLKYSMEGCTLTCIAQLKCARAWLMYPLMLGFPVGIVSALDVQHTVLAIWVVLGCERNNTCLLRDVLACLYNRGRLESLNYTQSNSPHSYLASSTTSSI